MRNNWMLRVVAAVGLALPGIANATTLLNWGSETFDTATNLAWLDLTETEGTSANEALLSFSRYRLATTSEVHGLFSNAGLVVGSSLAPNFEAEATALIDLVGETFSSTARGFQGFSQSSVSGVLQDPFVSQVIADGRVTVWAGSFGGSLDSKIGDVGIYLVREVAPVPLPATAPLLLFGLGGLGWIARRKREASRHT